MPARPQFGGLGAFDRVLAVVAHPTEETFALGGLIHQLAKSGTAIDVIAMTSGTTPDQVDELESAARLLGASSARIAGFEVGTLNQQLSERLAAPIHEALTELGSAALLVFDSTGVTGDDDARTTSGAALQAAAEAQLPAVAWTVSARVARSLNTEFGSAIQGRSEFEIDFVVPVGRKRQVKAISVYRSQSRRVPMVLRRLELSGPFEWTRWLRAPNASSSPPPFER